MSEVQVQGVCVPGFEPVREAFIANFRDHGEVGAGVAIYVNEQCVVDLTGGILGSGDRKAL